MNKLKLKEYNNEHVIYIYYPNGSENTGEIIYLFETKEVSSLKRSVDDDTGYFSNKAENKVRELVEEKKYLPFEITQAWY